jgi:hypothetical protein
MAEDVVTPYEIKQMENSDLAGLVEKIDESIFELLLAQSSGLTAWREADRTRVTAYLDRVERYFNWVISEPETDSPQTHPMMYPIEYLSNAETTPDGKPLIQTPENKGLRDCIRLMRVWMAEMSKSASRRAPNGIIGPDQARFKAHLTKIRSFLTGYIDETLPVDLPESNPSSPMSGQGFS